MPVEPDWGRIDATYAVSGGAFTASDGGQSQSDRYLLTRGDYSDFALTWRMIGRFPAESLPSVLIASRVKSREVTPKPTHRGHQTQSLRL